MDLEVKFGLAGEIGNDRMIADARDLMAFHATQNRRLRPSDSGIARSQDDLALTGGVGKLCQATGDRDPLIDLADVVGQGFAAQGHFQFLEDNPGPSFLYTFEESSLGLPFGDVRFPVAPVLAFDE